MALEKNKLIDKIEIVGEFKHIQVRYQTIITEDGEQISKSLWRDSFAPNTPITDLPAELQPYATTAWTDDIISAYEKHIEEQKIIQNI